MTFANQLESGGQAGRVHVSKATADKLDGAFELEATDRNTLNGYLKQANVETFFIVPGNEAHRQSTTNKRRRRPTSTQHNEPGKEQPGVSDVTATKNNEPKEQAEEPPAITLKQQPGPGYKSSDVEIEDKQIINDQAHEMNEVDKEASSAPWTKNENESASRTGGFSCQTEVEASLPVEQLNPGPRRDQGGARAASPLIPSNKADEGGGKGGSRESASSLVPSDHSKQSKRKQGAHSGGPSRQDAELDDDSLEDDLEFCDESTGDDEEDDEEDDEDGENWQPEIPFMNLNKPSFDNTNTNHNNTTDNHKHRANNHDGFAPPARVAQLDNKNADSAVSPGSSSMSSTENLLAHSSAKEHTTHGSRAKLGARHFDSGGQSATESRSSGLTVRGLHGRGADLMGAGQSVGSLLRRSFKRFARSNGNSNSVKSLAASSGLTGNWPRARPAETEVGQEQNQTTTTSRGSRIVKQQQNYQHDHYESNLHSSSSGTAAGNQLSCYRSFTVKLRPSKRRRSRNSRSSGRSCPTESLKLNRIQRSIGSQAHNNDNNNNNNNKNLREQEATSIASGSTTIGARGEQTKRTRSIRIKAPDAHLDSSPRVKSGLEDETNRRPDQGATRRPAAQYDSSTLTNGLDPTTPTRGEIDQMDSHASGGTRIVTNPIERDQRTPSPHKTMNQTTCNIGLADKRSGQKSAKFSPEIQDAAHAVCLVEWSNAESLIHELDAFEQQPGDKLRQHESKEQQESGISRRDNNSRTKRQAHKHAKTRPTNRTLARRNQAQNQPRQSIEVEMTRQMTKKHMNWFRLTFIDSQLESTYCQIRSNSSKSNIFYIFLTWILMATVSLLSLPDFWSHSSKIVILTTIPLLAFAFFYMSDSILYNRFMRLKLKEAMSQVSQSRATSLSASNSRPNLSAVSQVEPPDTLAQAQSQEGEKTAPQSISPNCKLHLGSETRPSNPLGARTTNNLIGNNNCNQFILSSSLSNQFVHRVARFWSKLDRIPMFWNIFIFTFNLIVTAAFLSLNYYSNCSIKLSQTTGEALNCNPNDNSSTLELQTGCFKQKGKEVKTNGSTCLHQENLLFDMILVLVEMAAFYRSGYLAKVILLSTMSLAFSGFLFKINTQISAWAHFNVAYDHLACPLIALNSSGFSEAHQLVVVVKNNSDTNLRSSMIHGLDYEFNYAASISRCDPNLIEKSYVILASLLIGLVYLCRSSERVLRLDFLCKMQATRELQDMRSLRHYNMQLLENILPDHVAAHFLQDERNSEELYAKSYDCVAVLFASIPNFSTFYSEDINKGKECIRLLNEIIFDFDQLLEMEQFRSIEKVKTISSTYMAACGLNPRDRLLPASYHLSVCTLFAFAMKRALQEVNVHSFNSFVMRIGISHGPIVGGVIGAKKPVFDIWGDTVNEASRMDSTGTNNQIQCPKRSAEILASQGFSVQLRGVIPVKGKGDMETYYVSDQNSPSSIARPAISELKQQSADNNIDNNNNLNLNSNSKQEGDSLEKVQDNEKIRVSNNLEVGGEAGCLAEQQTSKENDNKQIKPDLLNQTITNKQTPSTLVKIIEPPTVELARSSIIKGPRGKLEGPASSTTNRARLMPHGPPIASTSCALSRHAKSSQSMRNPGERRFRFLASSSQMKSYDLSLNDDEDDENNNTRGQPNSVNNLINDNEIPGDDELERPIGRFSRVAKASGKLEMNKLGFRRQASIIRDHSPFDRLNHGQLYPDSSLFGKPVCLTRSTDDKSDLLGLEPKSSPGSGPGEDNSLQAVVYNLVQMRRNYNISMAKLGPPPPGPATTTALITGTGTTNTNSNLNPSSSNRAIGSSQGSLLLISEPRVETLVNFAGDTGQATGSQTPPRVSLRRPRSAQASSSLTSARKVASRTRASFFRRTTKEPH